jgi:hypothetical protein
MPIGHLVVAILLTQSQLPPAAPAERVDVVLENPSHTLRGQLLEIGNNSVAMVVKGSRLDVPLERVVRVDATPRDPLWEGALIGSLASGAWCSYICGQGFDEPTSRTGNFFRGMLPGAIIGALIDRARADVADGLTRGVPAQSGAALRA